MALKHLAIPVKLTFKNKKEITPGVYAFSFTPDEPLHWKAGQHGIFEITLINGKTGRKPFSISSAPSEKEVTLTTRFNPVYASVFKQSLMKLKKGDPVKLRGPIGALHARRPNHKYALLATGIGITPFRSLLVQLNHEDKQNKVTLFYVGNKDNHFYKEDLAEIKSKMPNVTICYIYKPERITGHIIEEQLGTEIQDTIFLLSGSKSMVKSYRRTLQGLGVSRKRIKSDTFLGLRSSAQLAELEEQK